MCQEPELEPEPEPAPEKKFPEPHPKQAGSETLDVSFSNAMLQYYAILCYRQQERYTVL